MPSKRRAAGKRKYAAIGKLLKYYRELHSLDIAPPWSQGRLAKALGVSIRTYQGWENGEGLPYPNDFINFVAVLKLSEGEEKNLYRSVAQWPPEIRHLPFDQNRLFTGRDTYFEQLDELFKAGNRVALTGLGGIGKTQLALEYAHRCFQKDVYRAVFWVNAADRNALQADYDKLAREKLGLSGLDERDPDQRVQAVKDWLDDHTNWLLIMDNADDLALARSFFPVGDHCRILLTTRSQIIGRIARKIEIDKMTPKEGLLFLLGRSDPKKDKIALDKVPSDTREAASQVVELLDGHPLALDQAGAFIEEGGSLTGYIDLYHKQRHQMLESRGSLEGTDCDYPATVAVTFALCFDKARAQHPLATDILRFCAFLHPDAIPDELFQHDDDFKLDATAFKDGVTALLRYSLLTRNMDKSIYTIHRLVQAVLIDDMLPELQKQWRERVVQAVSATFPKTEFRNWRQCERLLSHALVFTTWTEDQLAPTLGVAQLFRNAGVYLYERGRYSEAETLLARVISIHEQRLGTEHPDTATSLLNLASIYIEQGKYSQVETMYQQAISIYERQLGAEHPDTARGLHNLALLYTAQGKYEQAKALLVRVLSIQEKHLGTEHPDTATSLHNLASIYSHQGKYEQAELLYRQALAIREKLLGTEHPLTASTLHNLSCLYLFQEKFDQAAALLQQARAILEKHLGTEHPETARSLLLLATLYVAQGNYEQAEVLLRRALRIWVNHLEVEHPYTAFPLYMVAMILDEQGQHEQADVLYQQALSIYEKQLGAMHPSTQAAKRHYADFLQRIGRDAEAAALETNDELSV